MIRRVQGTALPVNFQSRGCQNRSLATRSSSVVKVRGDFRVKEVKITLPDPVQGIVSQLHVRGHEVYLVGGVLRRHLLKDRTPIHDFDLTTDALPDQIEEAFRGHALENSLQIVSKPFGHMIIEVKRLSVDLVTLGEWKDADEREYQFTRSVEKDLQGRDFTINAMALDLRSGILHDYCDGQRDLALRMIRTQKPAEAALRNVKLGLRAIRIGAALGFDVSPDLLSALRERPDIWKKIKPDKKWEEILKLLEADKPSVGLRQLYQLGALGLFIPEILGGRGVRAHPTDPYDLYERSLITCDFFQGTPLGKLAALLVHSGKSLTQEKMEDGSMTFDPQYERFSALIARKVIKRLHPLKGEAEAASHYVENLLLHSRKSLDESVGDEAILDLMELGKTFLEDLISLQLALYSAERIWIPDEQILGPMRQRLQATWRRHPRSIQDLAIKEHQVRSELGITPGNAKRALTHLLERVCGGTLQNEERVLITALHMLPAGVLQR